MKKFALLAVAAVGVMAACSKNEVAPSTGGSQPETGYQDGKVPVRFGVGAPAALLTKSTGTVGGLADANVWDQQTLYIFGFDRTVADFTNAETDAFIWHVEATAPDGEASDYIDVMNPDPDGDGMQNDEGEWEPFYYGGNIVYDFYGYHIDDAYWDGAATSNVPVPVAEADRIYVPFKIDGGQDLMVAKADPDADILGTEVIDARNAYSAYSARRGVEPNLVFKHQLARFTFEIVPGSASANNVQVESLKLESKTTGKLVVVGTAETQLGIPAADVEEEKSWLTLRQKNTDSGELEPLAPVGTETFDEAPEAEQTSKAIGESILAIPGESVYNIELTLGDKAGSQLTPIAPLPLVLDVNDVVRPDSSEPITTFQAGESYKITIVIYGLEEVKIKATLEEWKDGGTTVIDPDEPPFSE